MSEEMSPELTAALRERSFLRNAAEARENGYELICSECGRGVYDESDMHERWCPNYVPESRGGGLV